MRTATRLSFGLFFTLCAGHAGAVVQTTVKGAALNAMVGTSTGWTVRNPGPAICTYRVSATGTATSPPAAAAAIGRTMGSLGSKDKPTGPGTKSTTGVLAFAGAAYAGANIESRGDCNGSRGFWDVTFAPTLTSIANVGIAASATNTARWHDPVQWHAGNIGDVMTWSVGLAKGTQIQRFDSGVMITAPKFSMRGAVTPTLIEEPEDFWPAGGSLPTGITELYSLSIVESGGALQATVNLPGMSSSGLGVSFSTSAGSVKNAIESANWVASGYTWTLQEDLVLFDLLTTNTGLDLGSDVTFGQEFGVDSMATIPAPGSALLLMAAGIAAPRRRRRELRSGR